MALFGGGFATGLVTGLAESANKALKEDIDRIRTSIESTRKLQTERAIDEYNDRKKKSDDLQDALSVGASLYGDPKSPEALAFAQGILKEEGSISAFKARIANMKAKQAGTPNFKEVLRGMVDMPNVSEFNFTKKDIAEDFLGPATYTQTPYTAVDSGLVGSLFSGADEKIKQRVQQGVTKDLTDRGIITDTKTGRKIPQSYFDRDAYIVFNMTPSERVEHYRSIEESPTATDEEKADATQKVQQNLDIIRDRKFQEAEAPEKVSMLKSDFLNLSAAERRGEKGTAILKQLSGFEGGQDFLTEQFGSYEEQLAVLMRQYRTAEGDTKNNLENAIEALSVEQRKVKAMQGSQSDQVAFDIDDAIRTGNSELLSSALAEARNIDAVNDLTKNISLSEKAAASKAINSLALAKFKMSPLGAAGYFEVGADGSILGWVGDDEQKAKANALLAEILEEVTNDAITTATAPKEKEILRQVASITASSLTAPEPSETEQALLTNQESKDVADKPDAEKPTVTKKQKSVNAIRNSIPNNNLGAQAMVANVYASSNGNVTQKAKDKTIESAREAHGDAFADLVAKAIARRDSESARISADGITATSNIGGGSIGIQVPQASQGVGPSGPSGIGVVGSNDVAGGSIGTGSRPSGLMSRN